MDGYDDAVSELYQAPLTQFIAERKRLAAALKAGGDAGSAKRLLARKRPTISVWVVNQLWWHARDAFDDLLATAEKLRDGDMKASTTHRAAISALRARAKTLLADADHTPTEATLRRVTTTLSAIAVTGGFEPEPPGALAEDRDPPGFAAFGLASADDGDGDDDDAKPEPTRPPSRAGKPAARDQARLERDAHKARAAEAAAEVAEKKRAEAEKKRIAAERHRVEAALRAANAELHDRERAVKQLEKQLAHAHGQVEGAQEIVGDLERKLDELDG